MQKKTLVAGVVVVLAATGVLLPGVAPSSAAPAVAAQRTDQGVLLSLPGGGTERINVRGDRILQVSYVASGALPTRQSLSVNAQWPAQPSFTLTTNASSVVLKTAQLTATIDTDTGLISYADTGGNALTAELSKTFGTSPSTAPGALQQADTTFTSPAGEGLFGLGQHQDGVMNDKGHQVTLDQFNNGGVGGEIGMPVMMSSRGYGLLWDTTSRSHFYGEANSNTAYRFSAESDSMIDYYFMYGPDLDTVVGDYRQATGTAPMFPQWAYGLFQSKDHYGSQAELQGVADAYRSNNIPLDAVVQDWQYWNPNPWGSHVMDPSRYPDPQGMIDHLHAENIHSMISVWAKFDPGSANYNQLNSAGCFYHDARDGSTYGNYYDAYSAQCRSTYWSQIRQELFDNYGWDAFWLDASEWEAPQGARAYVNTAAGPGVNFYNAYPLEHTQAVYDGQRADQTYNKRVFTLTRSAFPGQQRNAAASWSGDTSASFGEFANQITGGLNFSLSGIPYWTEDIGGYFANGDPSTPANNELFTRWFEKGVFDPVFRIHGNGGGRELYGSQWTAQTKAALLASDQLRYRLMPYIYSMAGMVTRNNSTIMRPLVMDFQNDPRVYSITDEYMFGPSILVAPVTAAGVTARNVYLPGGLWYDFWTGRPVSGGQTISAAAPYDHIPLYVRAGSIIPMGPANAQYAAQAVNPTEIRVYPGADGRFTFYGDAGDSYAYTSGAFQNIPLSYTNNGSTLTLGAASGSYPGMPSARNLRVVFVHDQYGSGIAETPSAPASSYQGSALTVTSTFTGVNLGQTVGVPSQPVAAGSAVNVTVAVSNTGPGTAGQVATQLNLPAGWTVQPTGPTSTATLGSGQTFSTTWTVTPVAGSTAFANVSFTAHTTYTPPGGSPSALDSPATLLVTAPVQTPFRTIASTQAYFGQSGSQFVIDAAGPDIYQNGTQADDGYGAVYLSGAANGTSNGTAVVHVDNQQNTDPWAKAGLVMRNDLTKHHQSLGYVALVATPGNGIALQWDSNDDGIADSNVIAGGSSVHAPVWLKLNRADTTYTGSYSTDGTTWQPVGSATVVSATATQDVGMIATSHDTNQLGLATFSGFSVANAATTRTVSLRAHANGQYVCADNAGAQPLIANRTAVGAWEQFDLIDMGSGTIALLAHADGKYVSAENAGAAALLADRTAIGLWETFNLIHNPDGSVSLQAIVNNNYVTAENAGASALIANRTAIGPWEEFDLING
jgi:alpha-D-xyloside xylohydrolase